MTFNVQNLSSSLNKSGIAKASHFEVQLTGPGELNSERDLLFRIDTAELPGRTIATTDFRFSNYGPLSRIPYNQIYSDFTIQIISSEDLREKEYIEAWQNKMIDTGAFDEDGGTEARSVSKFNVKYFDDYAGTVTLRQYGSARDLRSVHIFNQAYPIILQPVTLSWADENPVKLNVTFAYRNYKVAFRVQDQPKRGIGFGFSIGPGGVSGNVSIPGLGNINAGTIGGGTVVSGSVGGINF
jgi:hypothetical protein